MVNTLTIGMDLGDKNNQVCVINDEGNVIETCQIPNTIETIRERFSRYPSVVVVIEASTHSPWICRLLLEMEHKVYIGNPRNLFEPPSADRNAC